MQAAGPKLFELSAGLTPLSRLSDEIVRCIDEDGTVLIMLHPSWPAFVKSSVL